MTASPRRACSTRILIANRGEIALRIIRACTELGIETVAVYSEADASACYLQLADEAVCIGPAAERRELPEHPAHHQRGRDHRRRGDPPRLRLPGRERALRRDLRELQHHLHRPAAGGDPPHGRQGRGAGTHGARPACPSSPAATASSRTTTRRSRSPQQIGYPVMLKAAAGGGGRGMRVAHNDVSAARARLPPRSRGRGRLRQRRPSTSRSTSSTPRHVEVQILADSHGNVVHLGERDCSHPAPPPEADRGGPVARASTTELRERMGDAARQARRRPSATSTPAPSSSCSTRTATSTSWR